MLRRMLLHQPDGSLAQLRGISTRSSHGSILSLSRKKLSDDPGTIQFKDTVVVLVIRNNMQSLGRINNVRAGPDELFGHDDALTRSLEFLAQDAESLFD